MKLALSILVFIVLIFTSCQKEIDWGTGGSGSGGNGSGGSGGTTSGDLLVKALQITLATNDTNVLIFQWDANKRLILYQSSGFANSIAVDFSHSISRASDGKIEKIVSASPPPAVFIDSIVYIPYYLSGSSHLSYVIDTEFSVIGQIIDSSIYAYGSNGMISSKETFTDFFGLVSPASKETYTYDANGNVTTISDYSPNGAGGYDIAATETYTYDSHKNAVTLGEESYIVLGAANVSKSNPVKKVEDDMTGGGASYTGVFSQEQFNSFDRPTQASISITPQPSGYDAKALYYYQ